MQFCCQVPSSSKLYRWCTVYMSATAPECDISTSGSSYLIVAWPTTSCFTDWSKRRHVTSSIIECPPRHGRPSDSSMSDVRHWIDRLDPGNSGCVRNVRCRRTRTVTIRYQRWWPWGRVRADRVLTTWSSCVWRRRGAQRNVVSEIARRFVHLLWCPKDDSFVWFLLAVDRVSGSTLTVVGRSRLLARRPGTHSRILSGMQRAAQTFLYMNLYLPKILGVYLKRTCSRVTTASSALGFSTIMRYTNPRTHSLTHSSPRRRVIGLKQGDACNKVQVVVYKAAY